MRGLIYSTLSLAALGLPLAGCGSDGTQALPYYHDTRVNSGQDTVAPPDVNRYPTEAFVPRWNPDEKSGGLPGEAGASFRDVASFTYTDRIGAQWLWQNLLSMDGTTYWERSCPIDSGAEGPLWGRCSPWNGGFAVADLGSSKQAFSSMSGFVFRLPNGTQLLAQTAFDISGFTRLGRTCPIGVHGDGKVPEWQSCSAWSRLTVYSDNFGVPGQWLLRDDIMYTYTDVDGNPVYTQALLGPDGTMAWQRSVTTVIDLLGTAGGKWSPPQQIATLGLYGGTQVSGWSVFTFSAAGHQILAETVISPDGTRTARRECLIDSGPPSSCTDWNYGTLSGILKLPAML